MTQNPSLAEIFHKPPTRSLEEVQKVNATDEALEDIEEFWETDSASRVLHELGDLIRTRPTEEPRFLYLHATFGSGKTHLLKLVGFATGEVDVEDVDLASRLANHSEGFAQLKDDLTASDIDHLVPVFLNLLDRDASKEPPIPLIVYEAIGDRLGFPTDPLWLLEWIWELEVQQGLDIWHELRTLEHDERRFQDVLDDRARLRAWLYQAVPTLQAVSQVGLTSPEDVRQSIEEAEARIEARRFDDEDLAARVREATRYLSDQRDGNAELLLGLDEVALFIGDDQQRYEEFQNTVTTLFNGPNPIVLGTGQWPLTYFQKDFIGEVRTGAWYTNEIELEGADTEIIVRKRWLRKHHDHKDAVASVVDEIPNGALETETDLSLPDTDPVESYPFRVTDLWLLREIMQHLLTGGRPTEHEHIQGRALLVLVRSLFTRHGWDEKQLGALVPWDEVFDLLASETTLIRGWVRDLLQMLEATLGGTTPRVTATAKTVYLLNREPRIPATAENIALLLADHVDGDLQAIQAEVEDALKALDEKHYVHKDQTAKGSTNYQLLSRDEVSLAEKIAARAGQIPRPQLRNQITTWLQEHPLLSSEDIRREEDLGEAGNKERKVPLRFLYTVLQGVTKPRPQRDAVTIRILASREGVEDDTERWIELNSVEDGLEDLLAVVDLNTAFLDRLRRMLATQAVLDKETQRYQELEATQREDARELEARLKDNLRSATVWDASETKLGRFDAVIEDAITNRVLAEKFPNRRVLSKPLQEISDAEGLDKFFRREGPWPLDRQDATLLGVDRTTRELEGGWAGDFLERFGDQAVVDGQTLVDQIEGRSGAYLGSPLESLAALLLTLATAGEIQLLKDGDVLRSARAMGQAVRTKTDIQRLEVRMEPGPGVEEVDRLRSVHEALLGSPPDTDDPGAISEHIAEWTRNRGRELLEIHQRLAREFPAASDLSELREALEPANEGDPLDPDELSDALVGEQAERFAHARTLFQGEAQRTWTTFQETADLLETLYPGEQRTRRFRSIIDADSLPDPSLLTSELDEATRLRMEALTSVYEAITDTRCPADEPKKVPGSLEDWLQENRSELSELLDEAEGKLGDRATFEALRDLLAKARDEELGEADLVRDAVQDEAEQLARCRDLLTQRDGDPPLWEQLETTGQQLQQEHPEASVTSRVQRTLTSSSLPSPGTVEKLLEASEDPTEEDEAEPDGNVEAILEHLETLEDDTIVLIDPKETEP